MPSSVTLETDEWNKLLAMLAQAPWHQANPLIMKIGAQLQGTPVGGQRSNSGGLGEADQAQSGDRRPDPGAH